MTQTHYIVTAKLQNTPGVLARITILFRKFNVNIQAVDASPIDEKENFHEIHFILETTKNDNDFAIVMKKLARLVPVIEVEYLKQPKLF